MLDGQRQERYEDIEKGSLVFSPDSNRLAYVVRADKTQFAVVDGQEQKRYKAIYEGSLVFSPDSQRVAYVVEKDRGRGYREAVVKTKFAVVDGQEEKQHYGDIRSLVFSPDSQRLAYVAHVGGKQFVLANEQEDKHYDKIDKESLVFSPDHERLAYVALVGQREFVVVDGQEEEQYDSVWSPVFSPDSQRLAYGANDTVDNDNIRPDFVVVDGREKHGNGNTSVGGFLFSPDSQRLAYVAGRYVVVVGGADWKHDTGSLWIQKDSLVFSPDSQRVVYVANVGGWTAKWVVVVDRHEGSRYDQIVAAPQGRSVIFDSSDQLHYIARKGEAFYLVEERLA